MVRRDGTVVTAERRAVELLHAPDADALVGRDWASLVVPPDSVELREARRAMESGGSWSGSLRFRYAHDEVRLAASVAPVARSTDLSVVSLEPDGQPSPPVEDAVHPQRDERPPAPRHAAPRAPQPPPAPARPTSFADAGPTGEAGVPDLRAQVAAFDAMHDLADPTAAARAVLQALEPAVPFDWAAVLRYRGEPHALGVEAVAVYPSPIAGVARGVRWSPASNGEALVYLSGEPLIEGAILPQSPDGSPLSRLPAFGLRSRVLIPLYGGASVAGALALYRSGPRAFDARDGLAAERTTRRLGELLGDERATGTAVLRPDPQTMLRPPLAADPEPEAHPEPTAAAAPERDLPESGDASAQLVPPESRPDSSYAESRLESMGELVAGVAHELNNPLTAILGYAQIVSGLDGDERDRALHTIEDEAQRAARIVRNLLAFARRRPGHREPVDLEQLIRRVVDLRRYQLEVDDVRVLTQFGQVPTVSLDEGQFEQVFLNLLSNAHQALQGAGGEITISTWQRGDRVCIAFADNGPGIPEAMRSRVFEPFFTTRDVGHGSGMGLALVFGIVSDHGGRTWVEQGASGGATFMIELPLAPPPAGSARGAPADRSPSSFTPAEPAPAGRTRIDDAPAHGAKAGRPRILVVDDEASVRALTREILVARGYDVTMAADGLEALQCLESQTFALVISDLRMPGMGGARLYQEVARRWPDLAERVLFVTGDIEGDPSGLPLDLERIHYLEKPFTTRELGAAVEALLRVP